MISTELGHSIDQYFYQITYAPSEDSDQPVHPRSLIRVSAGNHYENTLIQIDRDFDHQNRKLSDEKSCSFHMSAQNIDCGYQLEPPRRASSNENLHSIFEQK